MEVPFNTSPEPQDPKPIAVPAPAVPPPAPIIAAKPPEVDMPSMPQADMSAVQLWVNQFQKSADAQRAEQVKSFRAAVAENPDQAAKKVAVAKELGLDPTDPSQDWKIAEQFSKQREIERQAFDWKYPELAAKMREWDFAAQAYDDLGNLQNIEGLWQWIKANWNQGQMMVERGQIGTRIAMGWSSQEDLERLEEINNAKKLPERTGLAYGIFGGTSEVLGQMSETLPASLAAAGAAVGMSAVAPPAGIITGPTAFLLTQGIQTAQIEGGNAYLDYLEAGLGEDEAKTSAFFVGVFNGAVETALGKFALKPFTSLGNKIGGKVMPKVFQPVTAQSGLADMAKAYALGVAGEVTTETVQEISQIAGQELATMYSREELDLLISTQDGRQQIYDRLGNIIAKTTMSMAVLGLPGPMANFMVDMQRAEAAKADTQIIKAISQGVKDARLAERNPQLAKEFVETAQGEAVTEVFINSETLRSRLTAIDQKATEEGKLQKSAFDVLREKLPEVSKQLDLAVGSNDTIRIKTSEMATQLAKSDVLSILMDDVRIDPNGMSMNEAIEYQPHIQKMAGQMKAQISEKAQQDKAFRESANRLRSQFVSQIVAAGRPLEQARIAANLQTMFVMRMVTTENAANGSSMLPEEWHAMHGMTTGAAETAAPIARPPLWLPKVVQEREQAATAQPEQITPEAVAEVAPSEPVAPPAQELTPYEQALDILTDPNAQITPEQRAELEQYVQQAEEQSLRSFAGPSAVTADPVVLKSAQDRVAAGESSEQVRKDTGWFTGADGKWRFEIDDSQAKLHPQMEKILKIIAESHTPFNTQRVMLYGVLTFWEGLKNNTLPKPQVTVNSLGVSEQQAIPPVYWSIANGREEGFQLTEDELRKFVQQAGVQLRKISRRDVKVPLESVLTHDQLFAAYPSARNWSFSSAPDASLKDKRAAEADLVSSRMNLFRWDNAQDAVKSVLHETQHLIQHKERFQSGAEVTNPNYFRVAGEVEARNVERRMMMTPEERRATSPESTEDVQRSEQVLRSRTPLTAEDTAYLAAVEAGDLETAQRMVDEAAKRAGLTELVYRGDRYATSITSYPADKRNEPGVFTTSDKSIADRYAGRSGAARAFRVGGKTLDLSKPTPESVAWINAWGADWDFIERETGEEVSAEDAVFSGRLFDWEGTGKGNRWKDIQRTAAAQGFDIVKLVDMDEQPFVSTVVLNENRIKLADPITRDAQGNVIPLSQRFDTAKDSILYSQQPEAGVGGTYERLTRRTLLNSNATPATWFHELMHYMFDTYADMIRRGVATEAMQKDFQALLEFAKFEGDFAAYSSANRDQQRVVHETVAYGWEQWLYEGKQMPFQLRKLMTTITQFFRSAWEGLKQINDTFFVETGQNLPGLTNEVRQVFSRMVAGEDQAKLAEATRAAVPLFLSREQWVAFGNPAEDWDSYMNEERNRLDEAAAQLTRMGIDALAIFSGTKDDRLKKLQKQYKEVRETMREEANSEVGLRKVYRLRQFLKNGTMVDAEGIEKTEKQQVFKMDRKMLLDIPAAFDVLRETAAKAVIAAESKLKALVSNEPRRLLVLPEKPRNVDPLAPEGVFDPKAVKAWELEVQRIKALNADNVAANAERLVLIKKARKELAKAKQVQRRVTQRLKTRENAIQERSPLDDYIKEGGLDPNIVRELFGYASVEEMVKELLNAPEFDEAVNKLIDLRMLREYGDLTSAEAMEEAVNMSLVNEHNTRWLTMELRTLERKMRGGANTPSDIEQQKQAAQQLAQMQTELEQLRAKRAAAKEAQDTAAVAAAETEIAGLKEQMKDVRQAADGALSMRIMRAAAREAARQVLSQRGIASIKPGLSQAAERRSSRDALTKLTNNDLPGAIQAKREQLLHNQMAAEAAEIQRYYKRTLKWFNSFFRKKDKSVAKGRSLEHVYAIRAILLAFGLGGTASQRSKRIADANMWLERLQKYEPTRYAEIKSLVEQAAKENKAVGTLTLEEFRRLESNVRTLWAEAEREKSIEIDGQKVLVEDAVASITDRASKLARTGALPGENKAITKKETAIGALNALRSSMRRAESLFDSWDGSEPRVFTKYFWRPLHKAIGTYRMSRDQYYKRYVQILKDLQPHLTSGPIAAQKYIKYDWTDMQELVAALTHTGNLSNKAKLLLGGRPNNPWATLNEDTGTVDSSRWEQMIADYVAAGILKQEHFDAVQAIWDLMEEMKPDIQRVYRTRFGTFFNEVPAEAFTITFADGTTKTYRGGYVPAKVDRDLVYNVFDPASVEEVNQEFRDSMPTTGWGFTITRMAGYNKPLDLDLSRVTQHIESVQRFVHIQPALWNVTRLLRDERVLQAFNSIDPTVLPNTIQPWLEKVASQRTGKSSSIPLLDKAVRWLRNNAGMAIMFGNISNTMQQLTGILLGAVKVKGSYLRGSLKRIVFASQETRRRIYGEISEKSQYMDQRFRTQIFDLQEQMNEVLINPSKFQKIQSWAKRHAYFMQQYVQNIVDAAVWNGAYEQAIADGQTEQEAVYRADAAVSLTQGGVQPEQISAIEGGQEWARLMTQFTGYFNMMANLNGTQFKKIVREVGWNNGKKELFHAWMLGFAAPTIAAGIIAKTFAGKWDDEDDDGYADETGLWLLDVLGRGALSMLPLGSSVMAVTINRMDDQTYNDRMMSAPAISMLERMGESLLGPSGFVRAVLSSEKDITGRKVRDVFSILDMVAGIPVSGIASKLTYAIESMTGTQENYNWADAIRGSITGISSEGTRQK